MHVQILYGLMHDKLQLLNITQKSQLFILTSQCLAGEERALPV